MALDPPIKYNDFWTYLRPMGSTLLNPTKQQIWNAYKFREGLKALGYDDTAIAGVLGNSQVESGINPASIQRYSILPGDPANIYDTPNSYMIQYYTPPTGGAGYGLGFLQWDRLSATYNTNDLLGWTNANGYNWYDGEGQLARLDFEFNTDSTWHFWRYNYGNYTWADYKQIETTRPTWDAGEAANVWASCWELSDPDPDARQRRRDNAMFWHQYFIDHPFPPWTAKVWLYYSYNKKRSGINVRKRF